MDDHQSVAPSTSLLHNGCEQVAADPGHTLHVEHINSNHNNNNHHHHQQNVKFSCPPAGSLIKFDTSGDEADGLAQRSAIEGVEILVMGSMASNQAAAVPRKEDEQITSAVMKVLQGYQWSLVPTTTK